MILRLACLLLLLGVVSMGGGEARAEDVKVGPFTFRPPASWGVSIPTSPMRKAELHIPDHDGKGGTCSFFHFGAGQGGTPEANIERWYGQFQEPRDKLDAKVTVETVGGTRLHLFRANGTFLSGMPGGPTTPEPNTMLLGAVLESGQGHVFVRCVAPTALALESQPAFLAMVKSPLGG